MKRIWQHPIISIFVVLTLVLLGTIAYRLASGAKDAGRNPRVISVGTVTPSVNDVEVRLLYTADIQPNQQVNLFSRVDGYIAKFHVDKGDIVKTNQLLVEIDHTDYVHAVNRAKANFAASRAEVEKQLANSRLAKLQLDRLKTLLKDQFVSQQEVDNAQGTHDVQAAQLDSLRAQMKQMEVALAQAVTNLAYSYIRAPYAGYIAERNLDPGAFVTGATGSTSTVARGILTLHEIDTVRILIEVVEKDVPLIKIGQKAEVRAEAYPDRVFEGEVTRILQALNRATRTMTIEVDLLNKDHTLTGGMFARVEVLVGKHLHAVQIPIDAVTRLEQEQYVYTVRDGKAHKILVELGVRSEETNLVEITKGLSGSETLIVSGKDLVSDGTRVEAKPLAPAAAPAPVPAPAPAPAGAGRQS